MDWFLSKNSGEKMLISCHYSVQLQFGYGCKCFLVSSLWWEGRCRKHNNNGIWNDYITLLHSFIGCLLQVASLPSPPPPPKKKGFDASSLSLFFFIVTNLQLTEMVYGYCINLLKSSMLYHVKPLLTKQTYILFVEAHFIINFILIF